ncbi:MAG: SDR family oxidoreductase [Pseudomonadota bacterium]
MSQTQTVLITGAGRGLGLEFARQYLADGCRVVVLQRAPSDALSALMSGAGGDRLSVGYCDLTDDNAMRDAVATLDIGALDVLIHNAGSMGRRTFGEAGQAAQALGTFDRAEWDALFDINVYTPLALTELLLPALKRSSQPKVIAISSVLGSIGANNAGGIYGYRASKAALNAIVKSLSIDLAGDKVIATALHPGWVRTDMGGSDAHLSATESVTGLRQVIDSLDLDRSGHFIGYDGEPLPW